MITAHELFYKMLKENDECTSVDMMIEFAKLHVEASLKAVAKNGKETWDWTTEECNSVIEDAYPLENIK